MGHAFLLHRVEHGLGPVGKLVLLAVIPLFFCHGAERFYLTLKDMKAGPLLFLKSGTCGVAAAMTLATFALLVSIDRLVTFTARAVWAEAHASWDLLKDRTPRRSRHWRDGGRAL